MSSHSKAFCALAWLHFYTNSDGTFRPCCVYNDTVVDEAGKELSVRTHSLEEIWNSKPVREIRERMYQGKGLKGCQVCYQNEKVSGHSYRTWANSWLLEEHDTGAANGAKIEQAAASGQVAAFKPVTFDVRLGNLCNLKCRSCSNVFSSQIEKDPVHSKYMTALPVLQSRFVQEPWYESDELRNELYDFSEDVILVQLAGGEPTINKIQMSWLDHLIETGRAGEVAATVWSNFTTLNARFYEIMTHFKQFTLMMSIDSYGDALEYLRYPAKWSVIENNVRQLKAKVMAPQVNVSPVVQLCNAMNLVDLFQWAHGHGFYVTLNRLSWPGYLHYNLLPPKARDIAVARLEEYISRPETQKHTAFIAEVRALINEFKQLGNSDPQVNAKTMDAFWRFTKDLDASRGQSFEKTFPELNDLLHEFYGEAALV